MKLMGIDYGTRHVGIALSDDAGEFAFPHTVIENSRTLAKEIQKICESEKVEEVVLGESLNYKKVENPIMEKIKKLKDELESSHFIVRLEPEFLTSQEAKRGQEDSTKMNASAAALILQSYIDKNK